MEPDFGRFRHQCQSVANSNRAGRTNVRDNVLVMSQEAADELIRGRLPVQHAREIGVAVIDAPGSNAETTRAALVAAYPMEQFSDFVCAEAA